MNLRVLSVRQPWASLLLSGVKRYECRRWRPKQPGILLMHASSSKAAGMPEMRRERLFQEALRDAHLEDEEAWPFSAIIGAVEITRFWEPHRRPRGVARAGEGRGLRRLERRSPLDAEHLRADLDRRPALLRPRRGQDAERGGRAGALGPRSEGARVAEGRLRREEGRARARPPRVRRGRRPVFMPRRLHRGGTIT